MKTIIRLFFASLICCAHVSFSQCVVNINPTPQLFGCFESVSPVVWTDAVTVNVSGNSIDRISSNGWNAGAASTHNVLDNMFVTTVAAETNRARMIGLSNTNPNASYTSIDFALYLRSNGTLRVYENGSYKGTFGNYVTGDKLKVSSENGVIKYYNNDLLLYTSLNTPTFPLIVDASIYHDNGTLQDVNIGTYVNSNFSCQASNIGTSLTYQWKLNGANVGSNSNTYSNTAISSTDVLVCEVTPASTFCGGSPVNSNVLNFENNLQHDMTANVNPVFLNAGCIRAEIDVVWTDLIRVNLTVNNVQRSSGNGWNSGAVSQNDVNDNMFTRTIVNETNKRRFFGLSDANPNAHYNSIDYAFYLLHNGSLRIYESGSYKGAFGTYVSGDSLAIFANNGVIEYYKNSQLLYTSAQTPTFPLNVDMSIYDNSGTIEQTVIGGYIGDSFTCAVQNMGTNPAYQWYHNTTAVGTNSNAYSNSSLADNDSVYCVITPGYNNCAGSSYQTPTVKLYSDVSSNFKASIEPVYIAAGCKKAITPVTWKEEQQVVTNGNSLTKSGSTGWNSGAISTAGISNNTYMTTVVNETNSYRMVGLTNDNTNAHYNTIDYAFYLVSGGTLLIYESGAYRFNAGTYSSGDTLKIGIESNVVKYYVNETLVYTSNAAPTLPLYADCSIYNNNGTFEQVNFEGYVQDQFTCTGNNFGASATYQWMLNGQPVGTNSTTYTNANLSHNDKLKCVVTPSIANCTSSSVETFELTIIEDFSPDITAAVIATPVTSGCLKAESDVVWTDKVKVTVTGNDIVRNSGNGWGSGGAASVNEISDNMYMYTVVDEVNTYRMVGLSNGNTNASWNTIDYAFYLISGGTLRIYESGSYRGTFGSYATGDTLKVSVESNVVLYYVNDNLVYTSNVTPTFPLIVDAAIYSNNGSVKDAKIGNLTQDTYVCNTTNVGANPTYQWYLNGNQVGSNSDTYINGTLGLNDELWCQVTPDISNCYNTEIISNKVFLSGSNYDLTTWNGSVGTDWLNASNWSNGVPASNKSANIPTGLTDYPVINGNVNCQNMIIESGASVDLISNDTIFVTGAWQNSGQFTSNSGTVSLSPNCSNSLSFYNANPHSFYNLMIDNGAQVELAGAKVSVHGALALENGSLNTNDSLRMVSDANETARITEIKNGALTGNVEVERYIDAGATHWRFLTFSVSGQDLESFDDDFITSGFLGTDYPNFPSSANPFSSFYKYDESAGTNFVDGFLVPSNTSETVDMGQGWWIWCGDSLQGTDPFTIDATGPIYQGDLDLPVTYTASSGNANEDGWNMVANPYHCTIDWESSDWVKTNVDGAIFIWNPDNAQYASYVAGVGTNLGNNQIASSQAFWVHTSGPSPQLTIKESCKVNQDHGFIKKANQQLQLLRLKLTADNSDIWDETVIRVEDNATPGFDSDFDALKFYSNDINSIQIASSLNGRDYTINSVNSDSIQVIDLKVILPLNDSCEIAATDVTGIENMSCVLIEDLVTGEITDLKTDSVYRFSQSAYNYSERLRIHFTTKPKVELSDASCYNSNNGEISIEHLGNYVQNVNWLNELGDTLTNSTLISGLPAGSYYLVYENSLAGCGTTVDSFYISQPTPIEVNTDVANTSCQSCCDGEATVNVIGGTAPYQFVWDYPNADNSQVADNLCNGVYEVIVIDQNGCDTTVYVEIGSMLSSPSSEDVDLIKLYPNPTNDMFVMEGDNITTSELVCYNGLGQRVYVGVSQINSNKVAVNMGSLPSGIYYVQIKNHIFSVSKL